MSRRVDGSVQLISKHQQTLMWGEEAVSAYGEDAVPFWGSVLMLCMQAV